MGSRARGKRMFTYTAPWNIYSANNLIRAGYELWKPERKFGADGALYWFKDFE
jgi:hypothetical protein